MELAHAVGNGIEHEGPFVRLAALPAGQDRAAPDEKVPLPRPVAPAKLGDPFAVPGADLTDERALVRLAEDARARISSGARFVPEKTATSSIHRDDNPSYHMDVRYVGFRDQPCGKANSAPSADSVCEFSSTPSADSVCEFSSTPSADSACELSSAHSADSA